MASKAKRLQLESEVVLHSSAEEDEDTSDGENQIEKVLNAEKKRYQSRRTPQCYSKNAQMARQNRLKKKMYLAKLEKEVEILKNDKLNLSSVFESQSLSITQLRNEVKYLKGVLANSSDISKILRNIHQGTGMSFSTSLNEPLIVSENSSRSRAPISKKTMYPLKEEADENICQISSLELYNNELSDFNLDFSSTDDNDLNPFLFDKTDLAIGLEDADGPNSFSENLKEHNYASKSLEKEDVGICVHVSKHRVSVEFCSLCEEKSKKIWD